MNDNLLKEFTEQDLIVKVSKNSS